MPVSSPDATVAAGDLGNVVLTSVTRIADFHHRPLRVREVPRREWATGDYVLAEVLEGESVPYRVEAPSGRLVEVVPGDSIVGALGRREATLQMVGDWREVGADGRMDTLNAAGVLGRCTSAATPRPPIAALRYTGHAVDDAGTLAMSDFVGAVEPRQLEAPVVLIIGTSMSAGKTAAGKAIVRVLKGMGLRVAATKVTGVGRLRDTQAMGDAGADVIADFVDAGLPSSAVPAEDFRAATETLLSMLAASEPDVVVAEAGASPLEPYNGETAVEILHPHIAFTVLCASDPYAVVGVIDAFGRRPDVVSGIATSTEAGLALIDKLVGLPAVNVLDESASSTLESLLRPRIAARDPRPPRS